MVAQNALGYSVTAAFGGRDPKPVPTPKEDITAAIEKAMTDLGIELSISRVEVNPIKAVHRGR